MFYIGKYNSSENTGKLIDFMVKLGYLLVKSPINPEDAKPCQNANKKRAITCPDDKNIFDGCCGQNSLNMADKRHL